MFKQTKFKVFLFLAVLLGGLPEYACTTESFSFGEKSKFTS